MKKEKSELNLCEKYQEIDEIFDRLELFEKWYDIFTEVWLDVDKKYIEILHQKIKELKEKTTEFYLWYISKW